MIFFTGGVRVLKLAWKGKRFLCDALIFVGFDVEEDLYD